MVTISGNPAKAAQKVKQSQDIKVIIPDPVAIDLEPVPMELDILYEDQYLVVINKPAGIVVHPAPGNYQNTLVHGLLAHCGDLAGVGGELRPGIVHRLDKDTTGALVAAKDDRTHRGLAAAFAAGRIKKEYLALVCGYPPSEGINQKGIGRHPVHRKKMSSTGRHLKTAKTIWHVTRKFEAGYSLVRVGIKTGRTHQIRVHFSEMGFPVAGDPVYGRKKNPKDSIGVAITKVGRQFLHAVNLAFSHPITRESINLTAALPQDFRAVLRMLERN
jgi:23S rRNA pseudouridine1911/1915/1917 synthase